MSETVFEKWKHRVSSAWDVLTGRAYACYSYENPLPQWPTDDVSRFGTTESGGE